jgi:hypothetical protein
MNNKETHKLFKLTVKIGKKPTKNDIYEFETDNPIKCLLSIDIVKLFEPCEFILQFGGLKTIRMTSPFQAKGVFNNQLRAFYFMKELIWMAK